MLAITSTKCHWFMARDGERNITSTTPNHQKIICTLNYPTSGCPFPNPFAGSTNATSSRSNAFWSERYGGKKGSRLTPVKKSESVIKLLWVVARNGTRLSKWITVEWHIWGMVEQHSI